MITIVTTSESICGFGSVRPSDAITIENSLTCIRLIAGNSLAREADEACRPGEEEAPGEGADQHQLRSLGDRTKQVRKDVLRDREAARNEQKSLPEREREREQVGVGQVRLHGQHAHGPDVLD